MNPNVLHRWRREFRQGPGNAFPGPGKTRWDETQQAKLERKIGQQTLEIDFLKKCLQRIEEQRMLQALSGKPLSTSRSKSKSAGRLWRSLKYEEIYLKEYGVVPEARAGIGNWFQFYNQERPHQSLGNQPPAAVFQRGEA